MADTKEQSRRRGFAEEFDTNFSFDDVERIHSIEKEEEKEQNGKLGSAGLMAFIAGAAWLATGVVSGILPGLDPGVTEFLTSVGLPLIGFGALGYGLFKTVKLAFRDKMLNFPVLNVYRKTRNTAGENGPASTFANANTRTNNRRTYNTQQNTGKKKVQRSRVNRVFSGVAGGIAEYAGVSPALIRFGFVATMFMFFPLSVFAYLFLSIILPVNYEGWDSGKGNNQRNGGQQG